MTEERDSPNFKSQTQGSVWPPIPKAELLQAHSLVTQLEETQWQSADELAAKQQTQLEQLVDFAGNRTRFYRRAFANANLPNAEAVLGYWQALRPISASTVAQQARKLTPLNPPAGHGRGRPFRIHFTENSSFDLQRTGIVELMVSALFARLVLWYSWDLLGSLALISPAGLSPQQRGDSDWGIPYETGPGISYTGTPDLDQIATWIADQKPDYLVGLEEHLPEGVDVRDRIVLVNDCATSRKGGRRALQVNGYGILAASCPEEGNLHVQSESVYCEVIDTEFKHTDNAGRLVITSLNNFAMPLLRYDTGITAKWGAPCACGRGLPVLEAP